MFLNLKTAHVILLKISRDIQQNGFFTQKHQDDNSEVNF